MADGERETVTVEADNIKDARAKAKAGAETGSTIGPPVLQAAPTRAARPTVGAGDVGEEQGGAGRAFSYVPPTPTTVGPVESYIDPTEWGDAIPSITAPPPRTTFRDFTQAIDPDLIDPGSSTFVPPVVPPTAVEPAVPFRQGPTGMLSPQEGGSGFQMVTPGAIHGVDEGFGINRGLGPQPPLVTTVPPPPPAFVPPTAVPPAFVPPAAVPPAAVPPVVINPETGLPVLTDRELFTMSPTAGYRRAFGNVFGPAVSGIGPIAEYLRRQQTPLTSAFRGSALRDFLRRSQAPALGPGEGGPYTGQPQFGATDFAISPFGTPALTGGGTTVGDLGGADAILADTGPIDLGAGAGGAASAAAGVAGMPAGYSFENYLRTRQGQPRGLPSAYEQALEDVNYFRGLGPGAVPSGASSIFAPRTSDEAGEAVNLLRSAQRGRYSPLVSGMFGQPSYEDVFGDYMLGVQDRSAQGQGPQNFFNFAAQRFGL